MDPTAAFNQADLTMRASRLPSMEKLAQTAPDKVREVAEEFEGFFVAMVLESMFAGIETDTLFGGGQGESVFRSMMLQEYGKSIAKQNSLGLADSVQREILRLQEVQNQ